MVHQSPDIGPWPQILILYQEARRSSPRQDQVISHPKSRQKLLELIKVTFEALERSAVAELEKSGEKAAHYCGEILQITFKSLKSSLSLSPSLSQPSPVSLTHTPPH